VDRDEKRRALLRTVDEVRAVLQADSDENERMRTLAPASVAALRDSGLLTLKLPAILGGAEADPALQLEIIEAVSYIDSAAGWCLFIGATTMGIPGAFLPDAAIEKMFAGDRPPTCAGGGGFKAVEAVPMPGGYQLTGRWSWGSGIRHAEWLIVPTLVARTGSADREARMMVFPASAAMIYDNWFVMGLSGTGSCDYSVEKLFIPEEFTFNRDSPPRRGGVLYNYGLPGFIAVENAGFALGVARRALDEVVAIARSKARGHSRRVPLMARGVFQKALGEADLKLRATRALQVALLAKTWDYLCEGRQISPSIHAELRAAGAQTIDVAVEVAEMAVRYAAGSAVYSDNILQRCLRDLQMAGTHFIVSDTSYENHGQFLLGVSGADPFA
jgi:alkylation response protein AidB-like acyl-CoA dehydrogenase